MKSEQIKAKGRNDTPEPMFYYLQIPKKGMVFNATNFKAFTDFAVKAAWLSNYLQNRKVAVEKLAQDSREEAAWKNYGYEDR